MVDSWCHTWSQWGTSPRIGWCAWSWLWQLPHSRPLAPHHLVEGEIFDQTSASNWLLKQTNAAKVMIYFTVPVKLDMYCTLSERNGEKHTLIKRNKDVSWSLWPMMITQRQSLEFVSIEALKSPSGHDTSCSRPCICHGEDRTSPLICGSLTT